MARDDRPGGSSERPVPAIYVGLPTTVLAWRLRLCGSAISVVFLMAGESVALLFTASIVAAALLFAAGSALARLEVRVRSIRLERRR